ncbi:Quinol monooxygenase YgiN [Paenibacillus sophorae]|uniref:Antibiotic biosynthesis monooxygenase n=1 Tax=Paenibacillus sophorae TaxID=1333845 RepID=A0A1H8K460_9BACL|nr:putative quinol monooxygenase [Paenibacillus sophorae]QWU13605.1 antibiotic biosynthesis monooxygenase [Paenibacillus sophorae]SEN87819.1 Quinol monooxygenase YgiN [Paenibacillus sophorae]
MSAISITAILQAKPGKEQLLHQELVKVVTPSRSEEGCIKYVLHQSIENNAVFVFYEIWKDEESINFHIETDHYKQFRRNIEDLIESRQVHRLREVN